MKFGVVVFPGSNCDHDAFYAVTRNLGHSAEFIWHDAAALPNIDAVILPGGFSYGDYLRCGAIARFAPAMAATQEFAAGGGLVLGICNGFQVLCESHLLPGALIRNDNQKFVCKQVHLRAENTDTPFTNTLAAGQILQVPIAHGEGKYVCDDATLGELKAKNRVIFRYSDPAELSVGTLTGGANPNGSKDDIAGIANEGFNVLGLMPHPERAADPALGSGDGRAIFESLLHFWR